MSQPPTTPASRRPSWPFALLAIALVLAVVALAPTWRAPRSGPAVQPGGESVAIAPASYVGSESCKGCHAAEHRAWSASHHQQAMQVATDATVLGDFADATFEHQGVTSHFFRRGDKFLVRTDGPSDGGPEGGPGEFEIRYTFGVAPLQQYLVEFPGGRLQALGIAWDSRPEAEGGQRWFHLYPDEKLPANDPLHWTSRYQNWNLMCAECHSTNLRKGYDAATDSYQTTYSEINVGCEACHGPGSRHASWAAQPGLIEAGSYGLTTPLDSRWDQAWSFETADARFPRRDLPAPPAVNNVCANCHSRRSTLVEGGNPGSPLEDTHRLAPIAAPLYHADGQQLDEVYTWGSFLQSRMYQQGVTCLDCHDPHTSKTRAEGNALCARCHTPVLFDTEKHHFHAPGSAGARCTSCHMPARRYMVVHDRLDHSLRVPRPDLSASLGTPDACTQCHEDRAPDWAAAAMDGWYGTSWRSRPEYGSALHQASTQGARALPGLMELAEDRTRPGIVRATAATLAAPIMREALLPDAQALLRESDPLIRIAGLGLLEPFDGETRLLSGGALLTDAVRGVRIEAARLLADLPEDQLEPAQRAARQKALKEYTESLALNADWPAEVVNRGNLELRQGQVEQAIASFERALKLDPRFIGATVNLADAYRGLGRDDEAERVLRQGLGLQPDAADLRHALGLALVRRGEAGPAMAELAEAARLAPENPRHAYVHAISLHSAGQASAALAVLRQADAEHPYDLDVLEALVSILMEQGSRGDPAARAEALECAGRLAEIRPGDPDVQHLLESSRPAK